jgi:hypothetical protein
MDVLDLYVYMDMNKLCIMWIYCADFIILVVLVVSYFCNFFLKKLDTNLWWLRLDPRRLTCVIYAGQLDRRRLIYVTYDSSDPVVIG